MPDNCCAVGCTNNRSRGVLIEFHQKKTILKGGDWLMAIRRDNWSEKAIAAAIFRAWIVALSSKLKFLVRWADQATVRRNLPKSFRCFKRCMSIIDCIY